jgi:hypothetical protein
LVGVSGLTRRRNPRNDARMPPFRLVRILVAICCAAALAVPLGACSACGDWPWAATQKSCHDEPVR